MRFTKTIFLLSVLIISLICIVYNYGYEEGSKVHIWPLEVEEPENGSYEVEMRFKLMDPVDAPDPYSILDTHILRRGAKSRELTFDDLVSIPDDKWKPDYDRAVKLLYPQAYNLTEVLEWVIQDQPIPEAPINGPRVRYLQISEEVCHPRNPDSHKYDMVIIVKSGISKFKERQEFRRLYKDYTNSQGQSILGLRVGLVFSVGQLRAQEDNVYQRGDFQVHLDRKYSFEDKEEIINQFEEERKHYKDLIVGDFEDTYFNLTMKTFHSFVWASTFCRKNRPIMLFLDDDIPVSLKYLVRVLRSQPRVELDNLLHGVFTNDTRVFRYDHGPRIPKWGVLKSELPWPFYHAYIMGYFILSSYTNVERLALGMFFTKQFPVEDAYIGLIAAKLNISLHHSRELLDWKSILTKQPHALRTMAPEVFM